MKTFCDTQIIDSWKINVKPWIAAVRGNEIENRLLVTNGAIKETIIKREPKKVLDVGCGEGWLVRDLIKAGIDVLGIDAVSELIEYAHKEGGGRYQLVPYERLSYDVVKEKFDIVVCNFSLLGKESVSRLFEQVPFLLNQGGSFIIQTIHPVVGCGENKYESGWREGSWVGFSNEFSNPAPWYFRTIETWKTLFLDNGFKLCEILEPLNNKTKIPASLILIGAINDSCI